jgi:hypothetical protein
VNTLLDSAVAYAKIGWRIFPIVPGEKRPLTKHGVKDATTDVEQIQAWWKSTPNANIGLACGAESGVYAVDIDVDQAKGIDGYESIKPYMPLPPTVSQATPRGGVHALFKADSPPANKNGLLPGVDIRGEGYYVLLAPSMNGNGKGYGWLPGMSPFECGLAEYPDNLRIEPEKHDQAPQTAPAAVSEPVAVSGPELAGRAGEDILHRAALYLQECDPAVQGQAGHDKLFWAAGAMTHGYMLDRETSISLLANHYNPMCDPPWDLSSPTDRADFERKVDQSIANPPNRPRGWLLEDSTPSNVNIAGILASAKAAEEAEAAVAVEVAAEVGEFGETRYDWPQNFTAKQRFDYLTQPSGLLGEICAWINASSVRMQPQLTLACSLAFLGTLYGRRVRGEDDTRTNLYCIGVSPSSGGKNHAMSRIRALASAAGCSDRIGGTKFASEAAIERRLTITPACLFMCDEIGHKLISMKNDKTGHRFDIISTLMEMYSMATETFVGKEYATQEPRKLVQPCCSLYGVSEHGRLIQSIDPEEMSDGWIARCLIFDCGEEMPDFIEEPAGSKEPPSGIVEAVAAWENRVIQPEKKDLKDFVTVKDGQVLASGGLPPNLLEVKYSLAAKDVFKSLSEFSVAVWRSKKETGPLWMKSAEKAKRIAVILAAGDNPDAPVVSHANAVYACRLVTSMLKRFESSMAFEVSSGTSERDRKRILKVIRESGEPGITGVLLGRRTQWAPAVYRAAMLDDLQDNCYIVKVDTNLRDNVPTAANGRKYKKWSYWATEHFNKEKYGYKPQPTASDACAANSKSNPVAESPDRVAQG